jgi:sodium transport system permease protein
MTHILKIFKKEWKDTMRDRRTLITMIVVPLTLFPILMNISAKFMNRQMTEAQTRVLRVGVVSYENGAGLVAMIDAHESLRLIELTSVDAGKQMIRSDSLDGLLVLTADFDQRIASLREGALKFYYKTKDDQGIVKQRILDVISEYRERLLKERFQRQNLDLSLLSVLAVDESNLATQQEKLGSVIGGFLPYIFIIFCFMGSMYPAIDLAAGEKERGTLETLLCTPVNRLHILLGKFGVVALVGLGSAIISILGLYLGVRSNTNLPQEFLDVLFGMLEWRSVLLVISLLVPLSILFAAIELALSMMAKSFKEAQGYISPLMIVVIVPAFIGLMPGMELNWIMALIPVLNISLATKAMIAGTIHTLPLAIVYVSSAIYALASLAVCARFFDREEILFKS